MRDNLSVKHWYVSGDYDYIAFKQSLRFWLENELNFLESATFKNAKLEVWSFFIAGCCSCWEDCGVWEAGQAGEVHWVVGKWALCC